MRGVSNPYPWYFGKGRYGGITLPEGNHAAITYTNSLFDDSEFGQNYYEWLDISSHEVGHINHIKASNKIADKQYELLLKNIYVCKGHVCTFIRDSSDYFISQ